VLQRTGFGGGFPNRSVNLSSLMGPGLKRLANRRAGTASGGSDFNPPK
jgi:hypothetical protein